MPSRWLSLAIVAFWLATNGWLFYHDIWPSWRPGQPPPMTIDLIQEARKSDEFVPWIVTQNGRPVFYAKTSIHRIGPDTFEMVAEYRRRRDHERATVLGFITLEGMRSRYRVTSAGNLLGLGMTAEVSFLLKNATGSLEVEGEVHSGQLTPYVYVHVLGKLEESKLPAVDVPAQSSVLLPLHPIDRIRGLRPGQSWTIPLLDPLEASIAKMVPGLDRGPQFVRARVSNEPQDLIWNKHPVSCLVIDYQGDMKGRTWVEVGTGRVMRQEAQVGDDTWAMQRD
jgi:hypothetical protein